jgi:hypothetical protein
MHLTYLCVSNEATKISATDCILYSVRILRKLEPNASERSGLVCRSHKRERIRSTEVTGCNWPPPCFLFPLNSVYVSSLLGPQLDPVSYESFALAAGHARIWSHANFRFLSGNCSHLHKQVTLLVLNRTEMFRVWQHAWVSHFSQRLTIQTYTSLPV